MELNEIYNAIHRELLIFEYSNAHCIALRNNLTIIYGESDDIINIGGLNSGEIYLPYEEGKYFEFKDGTKILMSYGKDDLGIWSISIDTIGTSKQHLIESLDEYGFYSDVFIIESKLNKECLTDNYIE